MDGSRGRGRACDGGSLCDLGHVATNPSGKRVNPSARHNDDPAIPRERDSRFGRDGNYTTMKSRLVSANPALSCANWTAATAPVPSLS
jgi:hypothetical protein